MKDILLYESGSGGDFRISNGDLMLTNSVINQVYIRLFGGNIESSTRGDEIPSEVRSDWWGNSLLFSDNKQKQFNSETERTLDRVALNSSGRIEIESAIKKDLSGLEKIAVLKISVALPSLNKVLMSIDISPLINTEQKRMQILWDGLRKEIIKQEII